MANSLITIGSALKTLADLLQRPGDKISAEITPTGRKVMKAERGGDKYSITKYGNGTIVETRSTHFPK